MTSDQRPSDDVVKLYFVTLSHTFRFLADSFQFPSIVAPPSTLRIMADSIAVTAAAEAAVSTQRSDYQQDVATVVGLMTRSLDLNLLLLKLQQTTITSKWDRLPLLDIRSLQ